MRVGRSTFPTRIYDDGGRSIDRYTLVVPSVNEPGKLDMYGFNSAPYHPQGFGQFAGSCHPMGSYSQAVKDQGQRLPHNTAEFERSQIEAIPMSKKLQKYWYQQGVKAGRTEGWMNLEETLGEDLEAHPDLARNATELVQTGIEGWEETDHFQIIYGSKMAGDARVKCTEGSDSEAWLDEWQDYKESFWEGYLAGRLKIGTDIYKLANDLISKRTGKVAKKEVRAHKRPAKRSAASSGLKGLRR